jgi:hypothetical protein
MAYRVPDTSVNRKILMFWYKQKPAPKKEIKRRALGSKGPRLAAHVRKVFSPTTQQEANGYYNIMGAWK